MSRIPLTADEKKFIEELYANGETSPTKIGEMIGRCPQTICNYLDAAGIKPIQHKKSAGNKTVQKCPHCRATGHLKGARFCYRCGTDIRSESVVLAEKLRAVLGDVKLLPDNIRSEASDTIQDVIRYLEKQEA
jgi:hypothetical protein